MNEPGESNLRRTIAMARVGGQVNSATSEFFINLVDNTFPDTVDQGFTGFGVVAGADMSVVDGIAALPLVDGGQTKFSASADYPGPRRDHVGRRVPEPGQIMSLVWGLGGLVDRCPTPADRGHE